MKYRPTWINKAWGRKSGFKGKTKRHTVDYDWDRSSRYVKLEGEFDREDLMTIAYELGITYGMTGEFGGGEKLTQEEAFKKQDDHFSIIYLKKRA